MGAIVYGGLPSLVKKLYIREGNSFQVLLVIYRNKVQEDLTGATITVLNLVGPAGTIPVVTKTVAGNLIRVPITPAIASALGSYSFELKYTIPDTEFASGVRECALDAYSFDIVPTSAQASDIDEFAIPADVATGFRGAAFTFEMFTPEQIALLQKPAKDISIVVKIEENARQEAENSRNIEEGKRAAAESSRVTEEGKRVTAETARVTAEGDATKGRVKAENDRVTAENTRQIKEIERQQAETARANAEGDATKGRVKAEADRVAAEALRVTAEAGREAELATKAAHGYTAPAVPKTLKQVDDSVLQLAGDVSLLDAVQGAKIKDIETVISIMNPNQSAQLSVSGRKTVSLPKNASNGGMQVKLDGLTAENLVANGDFRNGTTGWINSSNAVNIRIDGGMIVYDSTGVWNGIMTPISIQTASGDKCYIRTSVMVNQDVSSTYSHIGFYEPNAVSYNYGELVANTMKPMSAIITSSFTGLNSIRLRAGATSGAIVKWGKTLLINLTQIFGAGNEPNLATCDAIFSDYFEGIKSFEPTGRVRSVGRNLFNKEDIILNKVVLANGTLSNSSTANVSDYIRIQGGLSYNINGRTASTFIAFYDMNYVFISASAGTNITVSAPSSAVFVRFSVSHIDMHTCKFERGVIATAYEPYRETSLYLTAPELRSVQKAWDEIRKGSNGYEHVKRILSKTLAAGDITSLVAGTNNDYVTVPISVFANWHGTASTGTTGLASVLDNRFTKEVAASGFDVAGNAGSYTYGLANFLLIIAKGTYANLSAAKAGLTGITINYKALTPVITPISYGGILNSAENGTVYHEPVIADAGVYDTKMDILLTDYQIATIEEIIKHENGVDTYLNVATAVIAGDGLSFTHPDLIDGDLVLFTYAFDKESTNGNITATFYDSNVVKIDTVTGKAYRINEVVTNGVLKRTLTEV